MSITLRPIIPAKMTMSAKTVAAVDKALASTLKTGAGYFKTTTSTWKTKVNFVVDGPEGGRGAVGTDSDIYGYVARGTRPHLITPKNASVLAFPGGQSSPKTNPGILGSRRGSNGGGEMVFTSVVHHPGTKARGFEEAVAKRLQKVLETNVTAAILSTLGG